MESVNPNILEQVIEESSEPVLVVRIDQSEWPVVICNPAFESIGIGESIGKPFADVIEQMVGRELALEISEAVRSRQETSFPVEQGGRELLLAVKPLALPGEESASFCAAFWRGASGPAPAAGAEVQHLQIVGALLAQRVRRRSELFFGKGVRQPGHHGAAFDHVLRFAIGKRDFQYGNIVVRISLEILRSVLLALV